MENREEILKRCANEAANCNVTYNKSGKGILKAMQEYSDQQNKHKLDEIERLKSRIIYWNELHSEVIKDNSKLQFELKAADSVNENLSKENNKLDRISVQIFSTRPDSEKIINIKSILKLT